MILSDSMEPITEENLSTARFNDAEVVVTI